MNKRTPVLNTRSKKSGYTLVETMISVGLTSMVVIPILSTYLWTGEIWTLTSKRAWSQNMAMTSSEQIMNQIRMTSSINAIDAQGKWIELGYPDGTACTIAYTNSPFNADGGAIGMFIDGQNPTWYSTSGITELMNSEGGDPGVFSSATSLGNAVQVQYRISQPSPQGTRDTGDSSYAVKIRFIAALRNAN